MGEAVDHNTSDVDALAGGRNSHQFALVRTGRSPADRDGVGVCVADDLVNAKVQVRKCGCVDVNQLAIPVMPVFQIGGIRIGVNVSGRDEPVNGSRLTVVPNLVEDAARYFHVVDHEQYLLV